MRKLIGSFIIFFILDFKLIQWKCLSVFPIIVGWVLIIGIERGNNNSLCEVLWVPPVPSPPPPKKKKKTNNNATILPTTIFSSSSITGDHKLKYVMQLLLSCLPIKGSSTK